MDITDFPEPEIRSLAAQAPAVFPSSMTQSTTVNTIIENLSTANLEKDLTKLTEFHNRYYKSTYGNQSSTWLQSRVQEVVNASGAKGISVSAFKHTWTQSSIIAKIPGKSTKTIVVGAHQDSINLQDPTNGRAPGADDNGSGSITILESLRALLTDPTIAKGEAENTIEFHWYSAEEAGLLGSQAIFKSYASAKVDVKAMLNQDMTGYVKSGGEGQMGIVQDNTDSALTSFAAKVIASVSSS